MVEQGAKLNIEGLAQLPDGNYAIKVDGKVFGLITAETKARFILDSGKVLEAGVHKVNYSGRVLTVEVRDLSPKTTFYDLRDVEAIYAEERRMQRRPFIRHDVDELLRRAREHNEKTTAEILGRVVVREN